YENESSDENNYSVCLMINQGNNHYLLTGDLEGEGEKKLVQYNNLPHCVLYKANHHGSNTSSTYALLEEITPEICVVSCCCGSTEYTTNLKNVFPSQEFCTNISAFTDRVYVTSIVTEDGFAPLNGNVVVSCMEGKTVTVACSESDILFKDTAWCKENRVWGEE
ncbi:MAG: ComEC/Rec2 family competence protein, partial [Christensenellaceae bacterium]